MEKSTRRRFLTIFLVIGILFAGDRAFSELFAHFVLKSGLRFSRIYRGEETNKIIIMGNSRGDSSFSPDDMYKKTGLSTIQLSYKGMSTELIECLFSDYLEKNELPEILILEVTNLYEQNKAIFDIKSYMYWSESLSELLKKESGISFYVSKLSRLYLWNGELPLRALYFIGGNDQDFLKKNKKTLTKEIAEKLLANKSLYGNMEIIEDNEKSLFRILNLAQEKNITVHLIFPPYVPEYVDSIGKEKNDLIDNLISKTRKFNNVYVHDMSKSVTEISMYKDLTHMNYRGSTHLLDLMMEEKVFAVPSQPGISPGNI